MDPLRHGDMMMPMLGNAWNQPISFGNNPFFFFENFIKKAYNPQFTVVSRNTTRSDLQKCFYSNRVKLIAQLERFSVSVTLTSVI